MSVKELKLGVESSITSTAPATAVRQGLDALDSAMTRSSRNEALKARPDRPAPNDKLIEFLFEPAAFGISTRVISRMIELTQANAVSTAQQPFIAAPQANSERSTGGYVNVAKLEPVLQLGKLISGVKDSEPKALPVNNTLGDGRFFAQNHSANSQRAPSIRNQDLAHEQASHILAPAQNYFAAIKARMERSLPFPKVNVELN